MSNAIKIDHVALADIKEGQPMPSADGAGTLVVFASGTLGLGETARRVLGQGGADLVGRAASAAKFKGKFGSLLEVLAPHGLSVGRLIVVGVGDDPKAGHEHADRADTKSEAKHDGKPFDPARLGGIVAGKIGAGAKATVLFDLPHAIADVDHAAAQFALGLRLRDYKFDAYKTKKKDDDDKNGKEAANVTLAVAEPGRLANASAAGNAIADGVITARTLVNEPANILYPEAFAERVKFLETLGVELDVLDISAMEKLGMGAIVGVSQGSARPGRIVVMRWNGGGGTGAPVAFIGKGVTFDTGGISIKPSGGMEDMKGDMAGAACVVGLMQALAGRKAKVDVIGAIGLVENMPGPDAQRPGDIVTSMSGQTIEIINTDAEGRLVLADVCWYVQDKYKPRFMIDLATLTGAILVALGQEHAGLFSNNDELAARILAAGLATGEKLWRMPLGPTYDKLIDSRFADMKNTGGRHAGSITGAQFIQRFVNDVPWAHLDIAGVGLSSPSSDINHSWGSGWGVRLLDRLVQDHYEAG